MKISKSKSLADSTKVIPDESNLQTSFNFEVMERKQNTKLIKEVCFLLLIIQCLIVPSGIIQIIFTGEFSALLGIIMGFTSISLYSLTYNLSKNGKYFIAASLLLSCVFLNVGVPYIFLGNQIPIVMALAIPISLTIALLDSKAVLIMAVVSVLLGIGVTVIEQGFHLFNPLFILTPDIATMGTVLCILISIPASGWLIVIAMGNKRQLMLFQNKQLQLTLAELSQRQQQGAEFSQEVLALAENLNKVAREQAIESQEQVSYITNVTVSLEELNGAANEITASADASTKAAYQTVEIANSVKDSSELATSTVEKGNDAVLEAVKSVEQVRERIELLGHKLLNLTKQTKDVGSIIALIEEISDETHLLALNASIEAAGGTGTTDQMGKAGTRFGVIAQEIKNLADRSRTATGEVRDSIKLMQEAVAMAVLVAEEGKKETAAALNRSYKAGEVIVNLSNVIEHNASQSKLILNASQEVKMRCDTISMASVQQKSASQQVLETLRVLSDIAKHNSEGSDLISANAYKLEEVSGKLEVTLAT